MGRRRTGTIEWHGDHWDARVTLVDGARPRFCLAPELGDGEARKQAQGLATMAIAEGATMPRAAAAGAGPGSAGKAARSEGRGAATETVGAYAERWLAERDLRGLSCVRDDRSRLRTHVLPMLGTKPIAEVSRDDVEDIVDALDLKVRDGKLAWLTAGHVWRMVTKLFSDAQSSKARALRVRSDSPCAGVRGPDRGVMKAKVYLYPSEFVALVSCEAVPLAWRRLFALAVYLFARAGELEALRWEDVDLARGIIHIHRAIDRTRGRVKATKTGTPRRFALGPEILPLLRAIRAEQPEVEQVLPEMPDVNTLAKTLRRWLQEAGVDRADLFANDATRKHLTFHDLRATGITWMAVRGDDPLRIKSRAGHASFSTTEGYIREAEQVREGFGEIFPSLPRSLH